MPRRVLLLLYLITEGAMSGNDDIYFGEGLSDYDLFEENYWRLKTLLNDCGMSRLDPRNMFDWLILYSLKSNEDKSMSDCFQAVLDRVFA